MSEPISVECPKCSAKLKLKSSASIGKKIACPKCKKPFVVPAPPAEDDELGFMNVSEPDADPEDEFSEPEQEEAAAPVMSSRSRGKKGKSKNSQPVNWQKPVAILVGVALVIGLFVGAGYVVSNLDLAFLGAGNKIDMTYLPPDSDFIVHAKVADAWNASFVQSIVSMPAATKAVGELKAEMGIEPTDIASVTMGMTGFTDQMKAAADLRKQMAAHKPGNPFPRPAAGVKTDPVIVVRCKTALDDEKFRTNTKYTEAVEHQGAKYYKRTGVTDPVYYFPKANTFVIGSENQIKGAIERGTKTTRRPDLDFIDTKSQVLVAIVPKDSSVFDMDTPTAMPGIPAMPASLTAMNDAIRGKLKGFCLGISAGEGIDLAAMTNCTTAEASKEIAAEIDKAIGEAKAKFAEQKASVPPQFAEVINLADSVLNSVKTASSGSGMQVTLAIPASAKTTIEQIPGLLMMNMMGGGGGQNPLSIPGGSDPKAGGATSLGGQGSADPLAGFGGELPGGTGDPASDKPKGRAPNTKPQ